MTTLKQLLDERDVDTELAIHAVKEWLQQKQEKIGNQLTDTTENAVLQRLLEELEQ